MKKKDGTLYFQANLKFKKEKRLIPNQSDPLEKMRKKETRICFIEKKFFAKKKESLNFFSRKIFLFFFPKKSETFLKRTKMNLKPFLWYFRGKIVSALFMRFINFQEDKNFHSQVLPSKNKKFFV